MPIYSFSTAVMHVSTVPARVQNLIPMAVQLPAAAVVTDRGLGVWDTAARAWGKATDSPSVTHHLVLQDDIQLCSLFPIQVLAIIAKAPTSIISFFTPPRALWSKRKYPPGVALCMPREWCADFIAWANAEPVRQRRHDNILIARWARRRQRTLVYSDPSIVQHGSIPSLLKHANIASDNYNVSPSSTAIKADPP